MRPHSAPSSRRLRPFLMAVLPLCLSLGLPAGAQTAHDHAAHGGGLPVEPGQGAFAALAEIVAILRADPQTDWSRVDINALRNHLVDMDLLTLEAKVSRDRLDDGMVFTVTGSGRVVQAIRTMVPAHAPFITAETGWAASARLLDNGAELRVTGDAAQIRALGFHGVMTLGAHHQAHHLAIARGEAPH
ncbi:hypothetical protein KUV28_09210 [Ferrimonas balearica]|nr:hypothetical protein [Ferrimonas balearica]